MRFTKRSLPEPLLTFLLTQPIPATKEKPIATTVTLKLRSPAEAMSLFGQNDENLKLLRNFASARRS